MLKPIKTVRLKTVGLGIRFARKITERAAALGSYDMSEAELVFAMGAARERNDLMSVLEMLEEVLDLVRRGFDRHANALSVRIINNIGIILSRGGFSREYFNTLNLYNKISSVIDGKTENLNISECRKEIQNTLLSLRSQTGKQTKQAPVKVREKALKTISEHSEALTLNTLNSGMFKIMSRNPELLKMIKTDKLFTELSLKNIEKIRRRTDRVLTAERFFDNLTNAQIGFLERFISENNLFSELRESNSRDLKYGLNFDSGYDPKLHLKYLVENSSEKSLSEFFETLRKTLEERQTTSLASEKSYFESAEKMRDFFVTAKSSEIERLIKTLNRDGFYQTEAVTLAEALKVYEKNSEKIKNSDEKITEIFETALERKLKEENFSAERFFAALETSRELKKIFSNYAWENYRSEETMNRFAEYLSSNTRNITNSGESYSDPSARTILPDHTSEISKISETAASSAVIINNTRERSEISETAGEITKEKFVDFLINSDEFKIKFSESLKNSFINASSDVAAAFAEYLVNTVREDSFNYFSGSMRSLAEKTEKLLYYDSFELEKKSAETLSLIREAWSDCVPQIGELYSGFTQQGGSKNYFYGEIMKLYSYLPKNNYAALSEFFEAAATGDEYFIELSKSYLSKTAAFLSRSAEFSGGQKYTFYDALTEISDNGLTLLLPLAGIAAGENTAAFFNSEAAAGNYNSEKNPAAFFSPKTAAGNDNGEKNPAAFFSSKTAAGNDNGEKNPAAFFDSGTVTGNDNGEKNPMAFFDSGTAAGNDNGEKNPAAFFDSGTAAGNDNGEKNLMAFFDSGTAPGNDNNEINSSVFYAAGRDGDIEKIFTSFFNSDTVEVSRNNTVNFFNSDNGENNTGHTESKTVLVDRIASEFKLFSEYLSSTLKSRESRYFGTEHNFERIKTLSDKLESFFRGEQHSSREVLNLIYREWRENPELVSSIYTNFQQSQAFRENKENISMTESFSERIKELFRQTGGEFDGLFSGHPETRLILSTAVPGIPSPSSGLEQTVYNIYKAENSSFFPKSIVINKKVYNAIKAFNNSVIYENSESENDEGIVMPENFYLPRFEYTIPEKDYFFTWESENTTLFNRAVSGKIYLRTSGFSERRGSAALIFSERISEKSTSENQRSEYNKAVELFYTDEYFESAPNSAFSGVSVNYAVPSAADPYGGTDNVSEKLGNIHEKIESIGSELALIKQREEETSREFVTKSEQKIFERELKSSIERDIYLAGKRHGFR